MTVLTEKEHTVCVKRIIRVTLTQPGRGEQFTKGLAYKLKH